MVTIEITSLQAPFSWNGKTRETLTISFNFRTNGTGRNYLFSQVLYDDKPCGPIQPSFRPYLGGEKGRWDHELVPEKDWPEGVYKFLLAVGHVETALPDELGRVLENSKRGLVIDERHQFIIRVNREAVQQPMIETKQRSPF